MHARNSSAADINPMLARRRSPNDVTVHLPRWPNFFTPNSNADPASFGTANSLLSRYTKLLSLSEISSIAFATSRRDSPNGAAECCSNGMLLLKRFRTL